MNSLTILLQAAGGGGMQMIIMMVVIFAIMYFFMIRPQQKKQKEINQFRNTLEVGSNVVTAGGIYGTVRSIENDNTIIVEIASFDIQKIKNPEIKCAEYQQGDQLGFKNVKAYVLARDGCTCRCCKRTLNVC